MSSNINITWNVRLRSIPYYKCIPAGLVWILNHHLSVRLCI